MGLMQKAEEVLKGHHSSANTSNTSNTSNTADNGPHNSKIANKLDPRVDSDAGK